MRLVKLLAISAMSLVSVNGVLADEVKCPAAKVPTPCVLNITVGVAKVLYLPEEHLQGQLALVDHVEDGRSEWAVDTTKTQNDGGASTAIIIRAAKPGLTSRLIVSTDAGFREFLLKSVGPEKGSGL